MEIKDSRITPENQTEAEVLSRLLREQELQCERDPAGATKAKAGQQLSGADSFKLLCVVERRVKNNLVGSGEVDVIGAVAVGLAENLINGLDMDELRSEPTRIMKIGDGRQHLVLELAARALTDRYVD